MANKVWVGNDPGTGSQQNDWGNSNNWNPAGVPAGADAVFFPAGNSVAVLAGLDQHLITLASLTFDPGYQGIVGTAAAYLRIGTPILNIPPSVADNVTGSQLIKIDVGTVAVVANIANTSSPQTIGFGALQLLGTNITLNQTGGIISVAAAAGETATITVARITKNFQTNQDPQLIVGPGATLSDLHISGVGTPKVKNYSNITMPAVRLEGGQYENYGDGAHTLLTINKGTVIYNGIGTIATMHNSDVMDLSRDARGKTLTTTFLYRGSSLNADNGNPLSIVFTNGINLRKCEVEDIKLLRLGRDINIPMFGAAA